MTPTQDDVDNFDELMAKSAPDYQEPPRIVSYGGGVQSTALLVLAAERRIDFRTFVFSNVGDDSEHPATLRYIAEHAAPYAKLHGIDLIEVSRVKRGGARETLYGRLLNPISCGKCGGSGKWGLRDNNLPADDLSNWLTPAEMRVCPQCGGLGETESRSLPIPVRMSNGAPGTRSCTSDFKIRVIGKWLQANGAYAGKRCKAHRLEDRVPDEAKAKGWRDDDTGPRVDCYDCAQPRPATVAIGISVDEIQRANTRKAERYERVVYPLVGIGIETGLRLNRSDCQRIIRDAGLPVPPKSSCFFCPFHRPGVWQDMARNEPDLFERSAQLEDTLNARRRMLGKDEVFLTRFGKPLREAIDQSQLSMFELDESPDNDGECDSGWCMT